MCLAIPGKVEKIEGMKAVISYGKQKRIAMVTKDIPVSTGDYVLVQMGCVVQKLTGEEAESSMKALNSP
ncbi:HypC/HybG/HupF family hydrogenase formation chaperone [Candidatus Woesearchaeota archaeon]|nr:HypC/HybG/HupF family hydrogenase formation chaperone [Candidatus Woesearchaeota archaeon]